MRWQQVFAGADSAIMKNQKYTRDFDGTKARFWDDNAEARRKNLFPFLWYVVALHGQLLGNRQLGSKVNVAIPFQFSYPGYNEILTGFANPTVNSNAKVPNKNTNVFEFIQEKKNYDGKVAVFSSWDTFPYIVNKWRNNIYVNSHIDTLKFYNANLKLINDFQFLAPAMLA